VDADTGRMALGATPEASRDRRGGVAVFLLGLGLAWNAGNVGPVVGELRDEFSISLTAVGVLSGTLLYTAMVVGIAIAPRVAERIGLIRGMLLACALGGIGSALFALSPGFALLAVGRVLAGVGLGFAGVFGPVFARATGGVTRVGIFGASFQLGIAGGLGIGSALADAGVDWRVSFAVSAAVALSAVPLLLTENVTVALESGRSGFLRAAVRSSPVWRLGLLFMAMFAVPLTLGAWFVHYVTEQGPIGTALAGGLAFVLFGVSALMREVGGTLARRGVSPGLLTGVMPGLAAVGLVAIALDLDAAVVAPAVLLMGAGFALPYAAMMTEAQKLFPAEPAQPTALLTMAGTALAIGMIPALGAALNAGEGKAGIVALAALVLVAGAANLKVVKGAIATGERPGP
jgi:MFS family permease